MLIDFFLIAALGFLGSFGHCVGMCGPLTVAFSLSSQSKNQNKNTSWWQQSKFHVLLNFGRILSYSLVGVAIGALGSILLEGGQLAGVGSELRQWIAIITGLMLILFGLRQINPNFLPKIPFLHPLLQGGLHNRLNA
ncbi:MAG: sulfite exporter TauE/SafE family protein, partial [Cyanobacteria bacterium P01_C01_bin.38]